MTKDEFLSLPLPDQIRIAVDNVTFMLYLPSYLRAHIVSDYCNIIDENGDIIVSYKYIISPGFDKVFNKDIISIMELYEILSSFKVILYE